MSIRILAPVALALLAAGCGEKKSGVEAASPDPLRATPDQVARLKTAAVARRTVDIIEEATGKVAFNDEASTPVLSPYTGRVVELLAKPGDTVRKGEPLFTIDTPDIVDAEGDFLNGRAAEVKAKAVLAQAQRTRERTARLVAGEAAAQRDLEQAQTDVISAESDLRAAQAQVEAARQRLLAFNLTAAEVEQLGEGRRLNRVTRVLAPIGGAVVARQVGPGQYVRPDSGVALFTIADLSTMWLIAQVYEAQIPMVQLQEPVKVQVTALPGTSFPARVSYLGPSVDPATRRVLVRCVVQNSRGMLRPEMFATFRFEETKAELLTVPESAVVQEGGLQVVWLLSADNRFERRIVQTGRRVAGLVEIRSGLREGEKVIMEGALFLSRAAQG